MERSVEVFKALSNSVRLEILSLLAERQLCVNALVAQLNVSQPAVSQHLRILEHAGLVKGSKAGYFVHYSLVPEGIEECSSFLEKLRGEVK
jgi:ArsR family transcriptional regulator